MLLNGIKFVLFLEIWWYILFKNFYLKEEMWWYKNFLFDFCGDCSDNLVFMLFSLVVNNRYIYMIVFDGYEWGKYLWSL